MKALCTILTLLFITAISFNSNAILITFQVDMNEYGGTFTTPEWNSNVNNWCGATCNPMSDLDGDNIWEVSVDIAQGTSVEYKFAVDDWADEEMLTAGSACTVTNFGFTNRIYDVLAADEVLAAVCWESCSDCGIITPTYDLTVTVDVSEYSGDGDISTGMYVGGTFNGFNPPGFPMTDNGNGTWSATLTLNEGAHEWKYFIQPDWAFSEDLIPGSSCTVTDPTGQFTNRFIDLQQNETLSVVCLDYCVDCANIPEMRNITFSVDMTNEMPLSGGVFVFGSFNNWVNNQHMLEDLNGDNIYETTIEIADGSWEYKFTVEDPGVGFNNEVLDILEDAACTIATDDGNGGFFVNRGLTVTVDEALSTVCFASCDACVDPTACVAANFVNAPTGLMEDQTVSNGNKTQLVWDHYSDAQVACIIKGGTIGTPDINAAYTQSPGQVIVQGVAVSGVNGTNYSAQLAPNSTFTLFNPNTFPAGSTGGMIAGAFYKWQVRCGCIIDLSIPLPDRLGPSNVHISPWSDFDLFTNLPSIEPEDNFGNSEELINSEKEMNVYPNPNNGQFVVDIYNFDEGLTTITVRDLLGEVISSSTITNTSTYFKAPIDLTAYPAGYYSIELTDGTKTVSKLVMKK